MKNTLIATNYSSEYVARMRKLSDNTSLAALDAEGVHQDTVSKAAIELSKAADRAERRATRRASEPEPRVATLPAHAPLDQVRTARRRQAVKRGSDTYLPSWSDIAVGLPSALLRSALFSCSQKIQAASFSEAVEDQRPLVANWEIPSLSNLSITLSGYELCQFDRKVYATCLDYYRDKPLPPEDSPLYTTTSFYEFIHRMNHSYGLTSHFAVRASLLRLSFAQLRLQFKGWNIEVPRLINVSFEDGAITGAYKASDILLLRVTDSVANLFGPGDWTAVEKEVVGYDGLKGWIANFYAGHSKPHWLAVDSLRKNSGYASRPSNFKKSLYTALDSLKNEETPLSCRVKKYEQSEDGANILVVRSAWKE